MKGLLLTLMEDYNMLSIFNYSGYSTIKQYWFFMIQLLVLFFIIGLIIGNIGINPDSLGWSLFFGSLNFILLPAIVVRRLRDAGKNPWWTLLIFIPMIGWISLIIIGFLKSVSKTEITPITPTAEFDPTEDFIDADFEEIK
jgi:uncharacterized membrane protein YhaH (DUF805 family)